MDLVFISFDQHPDFKKHQDFAKKNGLTFKNRLTNNLDDIKFCVKYKTITVPQLLVISKGKLLHRYEFWPSKEALEAIKNSNFSLAGVENPCYSGANE